MRVYCKFCKKNTRVVGLTSAEASFYKSKSLDKIHLLELECGHYKIKDSRLPMSILTMIKST
jgi:hypothetical protein